MWAIHDTNKNNNKLMQSMDLKLVWNTVQYPAEYT